MTSHDNYDQEPATFVISGGGIVGLVLALALKKHVGITPEIYEKAHGFADGVGAALGMYPNGMRVLRDIDSKLLHDVRRHGYPYLYRRWERHDGTEIATAKENVLADGDKELYSMGIRRWRLQRVLYNAVTAAGIIIQFNKATKDVIERDGDDLIEVVFEDGTRRLTQVLFGTDGGKSAVRQAVADPTVQLQYTGVTCLMGISKCPSQRRGINFPSSIVSQFHGVYFPTAKNEQCFQIHFPIDEDNADKNNWGNLSPSESKEEFEKLAAKLRKDGWHERYVEPLHHVDHAVKVGFALLEPRLDSWVYGRTRRIVLVGDAAHPPVPYVGQGAQMGVEDAGTLALLMKHLCVDADGKFQLKDFADATWLYERIRIPWCSKVLNSSKNLGAMQECRSHQSTAEYEELIIKGEVMMNDTLPVMLNGAGYSYSEEVMNMLLIEHEKKVGRDDFSRLMQHEDEVRMKEALYSMYGAVI